MSDELQAATITVPQGEAGASGRAPTLAAVVRELCQVPWGRAKDLCLRGKVSVDGQTCADPALRISPGSQVAVDPQARRRAELLAPDAIVYLDRDLVVVQKPAGVMTVPFAEGDRDTLVDRVRVMLRRRTGRAGEPGVVQRLDKDTTGLLVFARTLAAKRHLQQQFRAHTIEREYVALAHGALPPGKQRRKTQLIRDRGDGLRGSYGHFRKPKGPVPADAQHAITDIELLRRVGPASLVRCRLYTGRQHQVRIHLAELGHPLLGERVYCRDYRGPVLQAPRPLLHATRLAFEHPRTGEPLQFDQAWPADFAAVLEQLQA